MWLVEMKKAINYFDRSNKSLFQLLSVDLEHDGRAKQIQVRHLSFPYGQDISPAQRPNGSKSQPSSFPLVTRACSRPFTSV